MFDSQKVGTFVLNFVLHFFFNFLIDKWLNLEPSIYAEYSLPFLN